MMLMQQLPENKKTEFMMLYGQKEKNPTTAFILSWFLGFFGVDRFYIGDVGIGFFKLLTLGGFFIGCIIDLFLIMGATREKNKKAAQEVFMLLRA